MGLQWQFWPIAEPVTPWQLLRPDGTLVEGGAQPLSDDQVFEALRLMLLSRAVDEKGVSLQRQGRFGTFSPVLGQEASVVGSAMALDPRRDWIVPQYRELPALLWQGLPLERFLAYFMGNPEGGYVPHGVNVLPVQIAIAAQLPHAVGLAWGLRLQGKDSVVLVYFGDGASSEGDFHEACNLAGVVKAPVVFFLQNNGYAISTPRSQQSSCVSLASRAIGYGFPGAVVDGNDLFAVYVATSQAVHRARSGEGPSLIESITYRMGPHNTSDDPTRYVDPAEVEYWRRLDPVERVERYLSARGLWSEERAIALRNEVAEEVERGLGLARSLRSPDPEQLFEHVYAVPLPRLVRQQDAIKGRSVRATLPSEW